jgi:hypothetical protein
LSAEEPQVAAETCTTEATEERRGEAAVEEMPAAAGEMDKTA